MSAIPPRCSRPQQVSGAALYGWLLCHISPAPRITAAVSSSRHRSQRSAAFAARPALHSSWNRSIHLSSAQRSRLPSYPSNDAKREPSAAHGLSAPRRSRRVPQAVLRSHLPPSELRALNEAAVRERRRRLAARHKELSFLSKAPLLASALPPSLANIAPALPRTDFSYAWPSFSFHRVPSLQQPESLSAEQSPTAFESVRQSQAHVSGRYERQLRERKADKNKAIAALKQLVGIAPNRALTAAEEDREAYDACLEAVKSIRQLYSPLLTSHDYYTMVHAAGLCTHERLLARLLEDAGIASVRLPSELFARLLQLLAPIESSAAVRCVVVVTHEYFRQQHVRRSEAGSGGNALNRGDWQRLPLSAEQYSRVLQVVSRTPSTHLLQPLLYAFHHSSGRAREDIPLVCTTVLPALQQLWQQRLPDTLLALSSALLQWKAASVEWEKWSGPQLSAACDVLQLHFSALLPDSQVDLLASRARPAGQSDSSVAGDSQHTLHASSHRTTADVSVTLPDAWRVHLPPLSELCAMVPALGQHLSLDDAAPKRCNHEPMVAQPSAVNTDRL